MAYLRQLVDQVLLILGLQSNVSRHSGKNKKLYIGFYNKPFKKNYGKMTKRLTFLIDFQLPMKSFLKWSAE